MSKQQNRGFTIIEVVLVLAIAGLIFLMVFIALPALQRSQRDQARKNDASTVAAAINTYRSSNRGSLASISAAELKKYIDRLDQYEITGDTNPLTMATGTDAATVGKDRIVFATGARCPSASPSPGTETITFQAATARSAAVAVLLENNGSQAQVFCQEV